MATDSWVAAVKPATSGSDTDRRHEVTVRSRKGVSVERVVVGAPQRRVVQQLYQAGGDEQGANHARDTDDHTQGGGVWTRSTIAGRCRREAHTVDRRTGPPLSRRGSREFLFAHAQVIDVRCDVRKAVVTPAMTNVIAMDAPPRSTTARSGRTPLSGSTTRNDPIGNKSDIVIATTTATTAAAAPRIAVPIAASTTNWRSS